MLLTEWAKAFGRGAYTVLEEASGVSYKTVLAKARDGEACSYETAEKLCRATKALRRKVGGWCSIDELRFPNGKPGKASQPASDEVSP
jgi:hypothetical protein